MIEMKGEIEMAGLMDAGMEMETEVEDPVHRHVRYLMARVLTTQREFWPLGGERKIREIGRLGKWEITMIDVMQVTCNV